MEEGRQEEANEEEFSMAKSNSLISLDEVRSSLKRMQAEGERIVGRAREFVERGSRTDVQKLREDLRQRADQALKQLQEQRTRLTGRVEDVVARLTELVLSALRVVRADQLAEINRRLTAIERQLDEISKSKTASDKAA